MRQPLPAGVLAWQPAGRGRGPGGTAARARRRAPAGPSMVISPLRARVVSPSGRGGVVSTIEDKTGRWQCISAGNGHYDPMLVVPVATIGGRSDGGSAPGIAAPEGQARQPGEPALLEQGAAGSGSCGRRSSSSARMRARRGRARAARRPGAWRHYRPASAAARPGREPQPGSSDRRRLRRCDPAGVRSVRQGPQGRARAPWWGAHLAGTLLPAGKGGAGVQLPAPGGLVNGFPAAAVARALCRLRRWRVLALPAAGRTADCQTPCR
jgi:hypothetical protein